VSEDTDEAEVERKARWEKDVGVELWGTGDPRGSGDQYDVVRAMGLTQSSS
jgi:hypothetical protein